MTLALPEPIATYFRFKSGTEATDLSACFAPDAVVIDKGEDAEYQGREAILQWMGGAVTDYALKTDFTTVAEADGETVVKALVSGDFPGSPAEFEYRFLIQNSLIERLTIEFVGFR
jgi:hypothetical protein